MKKLLLSLSILLFISCNNQSSDTKRNTSTKKEPHFVFSTWAHGSKNFKEAVWQKKLSYYDSLGFREILVGGSPQFLSKLIPLAHKKNIKVHGWMWTFNRPGDTIANKHPEWYMVNRKGKNSLEYNAYVK